MPYKALEGMGEMFDNIGPTKNQLLHFIVVNKMEGRFTSRDVSEKMQELMSGRQALTTKQVGGILTTSYFKGIVRRVSKAPSVFEKV